jgi:hypothetical protein
VFLEALQRRRYLGSVVSPQHGRFVHGLVGLVGRVAVAAVCLGGAACAADADFEPTAEKAARCGRLGAPVTVEKLVQVFRANGLTFDVNQWKCERSGFTEAGATNAGPTGLESDDDVGRREGFVLCRLSFEGDGGSQVELVKFPTDTETHLSVLNVGCSVYPSDAASESSQVGRVADALRALSRAVPEVPIAKRCGSQGSPVTRATAAGILRDGGITSMRVNQAKCENSASNLPDITNVSPTAKEREGIVSCWVGVQEDPFDDLKLGEERDPEITVRLVGDKTSMTVLNVRCTIDPSEKDAARQIAQLRTAMEWL